MFNRSLFPKKHIGPVDIHGITWVEEITDIYRLPCFSWVMVFAFLAASFFHIVNVDYHFNIWWTSGFGVKKVMVDLSNEISNKMTLYLNICSNEKQRTDICSN